jgi:outer membrane protein assembly factor BamB
MLTVLIACSEPAAKPMIGIALSAEHATLKVNESMTFTATVTGGDEHAVAWSATGGTIAGQGKTILYGAPGNPGEFILTATSRIDPSKSAEVIITVIEQKGSGDTPEEDESEGDGEDTGPSNITLHLTPESATLGYGQVRHLTATVTGTDNPAVGWQASCGQLIGTGLRVSYTAPAATGTCTVTVVNAQDSSTQAQATLAVLKPGTQLWLERYGSPDGGAWGVDVATDAEERVIVLGSSAAPLTDAASGNIVLIAYDTDDTELWWRQFGGDEVDPRHLAIDAAGNFYIAGRLMGSSISVFVAKYNQHFEELWSLNLEDVTWVNDLALDAAGNAYLAVERDHRFEDGNAIVIKVSSQGERLWQRDFGQVSEGRVAAQGVAVDSEGSVYLTGSDLRFNSTVPFGLETGAFLRKLDSAGNMLWERTFEVISQGDHITATGTSVAVDNQRQLVYLASRGANGLYLSQYDFDGTRRWQSRIVERTGRFDRFSDLAVDGQGNVYAIGSREYAFGGFITDEVFEVLLTQVSQTGELEWFKRFGAGDDHGRAIISTANGLYLTGATHEYPDGNPNEIPLGPRQMFVARLVP